jgi:hypothetical protein
MEPAGDLADALVQICADYLCARAATADNPDTYQVIIHAGTRALTGTGTGPAASATPTASVTPAASPEPAGVSADLSTTLAPHRARLTMTTV